LVGVNYDTISNCYAAGDVTGDSNSCRVGGLVGSNYYGTISNCYATGSVDGNDSVGGLLGGIYYTDIFASFWDTDTTGQTKGIGYDYSEDGNTVDVYGKTTAQMQIKVTFTDYGWDFVGETVNGYRDTWRMCEDGVDYPRLSWEFSKHGDLTCPDGIDFVDYSVLANQWQLEKLEQDRNLDGFVDFYDWADVANDWDGDYLEVEVFLDKWLAQSARQADIAPAGGDDIVDWQDLQLFCENWLGD